MDFEPNNRSAFPNCSSENCRLLPAKKMLVGAVGVEPTTNGLKDQNRTQPLQSTTVSYRKISHEAHEELLRFGVAVCEYPHKSRTVGRAHESPTVCADVVRLEVYHAAH